MDKICEHIEEVFKCLPEKIYCEDEREKSQYPYFVIKERQDISTVFGDDENYDLCQKDLEFRIHLPCPPNCETNEQIIKKSKDALAKYKKYVNTVIAVLCKYYGETKTRRYQRLEGTAGRIVHSWYPLGATENKEVILRSRVSLQLVCKVPCCELSELDLDCLENKVDVKFWN